MNRSFAHMGATPEVVHQHGGYRLSKNVPVIITDTSKPGEYRIMTLMESNAPPIKAYDEPMSHAIHHPIHGINSALLHVVGKEREALKKAKKSK